jgi:hypothetical protein
MLQKDDAAAIATDVSKQLNGLNHGDIFAVRRLAKDIAAAITSELVYKDRDMVAVVQKLGLVLEPMINWLERYGANGRSLRDSNQRPLRPR